jgi:hypothetical protein
VNGIRNPWRLAINPFDRADALLSGWERRVLARAARGAGASVHAQRLAALAAGRAARQAARLRLTAALQEASSFAIWATVRMLDALLLAIGLAACSAWALHGFDLSTLVGRVLGAPEAAIQAARPHAPAASAGLSHAGAVDDPDASAIVLALVDGKIALLQGVQHMQALQAGASSGWVVDGSLAPPPRLSAQRLPRAQITASHLRRTADTVSGVVALLTFLMFGITSAMRPWVSPLRSVPTSSFWAQAVPASVRTEVNLAKETVL